MQVHRTIRFAVLFLVGLPLAFGNATPEVLAHLVRARGLVGQDAWASVLEIDSADPTKPHEHALAFEFADALWFYRPAYGTESLSRHWNNVAAERRNLLPLLQAIDPRFAAFRELGAAELHTVVPSTGELPNGCFVESATEAKRVFADTGSSNAVLLSYYVNTPEGQRGHTVLCYEDAAGTHLFDPADGNTLSIPSLSFGEKALNLARSIVPSALVDGVTKAAKIALADHSGKGATGRSARRGQAFRARALR